MPGECQCKQAERISCRISTVEFIGLPRDNDIDMDPYDINMNNGPAKKVKSVHSVYTIDEILGNASSLRPDNGKIPGTGVGVGRTQFNLSELITILYAKCAPAQTCSRAHIFKTPICHTHIHTSLLNGLTHKGSQLRRYFVYA